MKKEILDLSIIEFKKLNDTNVLLKLTSTKKKLPIMLPGQFVEVQTNEISHTLLRRPISIHYFDIKNNEIWLLVQIIGEGTKAIGHLHKGDQLNCMLPLGNNFTIPTSKDAHPLLVGGGVGVAPLLFLGHEMSKNGVTPTFLLGARTKKDLLQIEEFKCYGRVFTTTEDGSEGIKGYVTQHPILKEEKFSHIMTCGPKPMMMAVASYAKRYDIECEVSLENKMACGIGACLCCVEKTNDHKNVCVCKEGPVFNTKKLLWQI